MSINIVKERIALYTLKLRSYLDYLAFFKESSVIYIIVLILRFLHGRLYLKDKQYNKRCQKREKQTTKYETKYDFIVVIKQKRNQILLYAKINHNTKHFILYVMTFTWETRKPYLIHTQMPK